MKKNITDLYENYRVASQSQIITDRCAKLRHTATPTTTLTSLIENTLLLT